MQKQRRKQQTKRQDPVTPQAASVTNTETVPVEQIQEKSDTSTQTPKMKWNAHAYRKASIQRQIARGIYEIDRIVAYTGIPAEHVLPIYISITAADLKKD